MRISDWSSDVCSSDLLAIDRGCQRHDLEVPQLMDFCRLHQYRFERCAKANLSTDTDEQRLDRLRGFATCRQQGFIERVAGRQHANRAFENGWKLLDDLGAAARKIGRAACRERGGQ